MKSKISYIDITKKLLKFILLSVISFLSLKYIPQNKLELNEILKISCVITIFFVIIDTISPNIAVVYNK
jgi:hypothetical protein